MEAWRIMGAWRGMEGQMKHGEGWNMERGRSMERGLDAWKEEWKLGVSYGNMEKDGWTEGWKHKELDGSTEEEKEAWREGMKHGDKGCHIQYIDRLL